MTADFKCPQCGVVAEFDLPANPSCCGEQMIRIYSANIAFKGSGFYVNDYKSKTVTE